ncbi:leukocyte receptor cluster member 1 homolog [Scyliorhinus torazame]|uniref:leukocyte receptor cluster member 1 homolog n=1 Tax=Scyliorhinus torazame TaxID=75743 RepID=UPI003B5A8CC0
MNILPKKSWHVRNKDNVERVRRDEERAAADQRERRQRAEMAEREARTDLLRSRARRSLPASQGQTLALKASEAAPRSLNLFNELEGDSRRKIGSKEHEAEKRQEKEKQERALGLLTYLGQSSSEAQTNKPWYQDCPGQRAERASEETDSRLKRQMDPLLLMRQHLRKAGKLPSSERRPPAMGRARGAQGLQAERLLREETERARALLLLRGGGRVLPEPEMDDRKRAYNSQFHPSLSNKRQRRR